MDEKGYIQYEIEWARTSPPDPDEVSELIAWRDRLFDANLIGVDSHGVGFGNISERTDSGFWISGTQTGYLKHLGPDHFALVTEFDIHQNHLTCRGPVKASSEALSHAILYQTSAEVGAVVHVHDASSWSSLIDELPTTDRVAEAGTVRMAEEIGRLFDETDLRNSKVLVMGGHRDGMMSFGRTVEEAATRILNACRS